MKFDHDPNMRINIFETGESRVSGGDMANRTCLPLAVIIPAYFYPQLLKVDFLDYTNCGLYFSIARSVEVERGNREQILPGVRTKEENYISHAFGVSKRLLIACLCTPRKICPCTLLLSLKGVI
jgi:hypothetical protein